MSVVLAAGTVAGVAQLAVGHPFDTVKVKLQNMPAPAAGAAPLYASAMDAARKTVAADGPLGLYAGITAPLAFVAVFNAVLFAANAGMRSLVARGRPVDDLSLAELGACGVGAGFGVSWIACPTELVKCRLQSQATSGTAYTGPVDCARRVVAARGVAGLYKGLGATLAREMPANAAYFGAYEAAKRALAGGGPGARTDRLGAPALMAAGGAAGVAFWASVYPVDVVKTRLQTDSDARPRYGGMADCARQIVRAEGVGALYRGVGPCLARAAPANAVTFLVFEWVKGALADGAR
jgi:solute carrier family 25 (mitochondrial carnitine/acylcarnitine transporter), member 20/29